MAKEREKMNGSSNGLFRMKKVRTQKLQRKEESTVEKRWEDDTFSPFPPNVGGFIVYL